MTFAYKKGQRVLFRSYDGMVLATSRSREPEQHRGECLKYNAQLDSFTIRRLEDRKQFLVPAEDILMVLPKNDSPEAWEAWVTERQEAPTPVAPPSTPSWFRQLQTSSTRSVRGAHPQLVQWDEAQELPEISGSWRQYMYKTPTVDTTFTINTTTD